MQRWRAERTDRTDRTHRTDRTDRTDRSVRTRKSSCARREFRERAEGYGRIRAKLRRLQCAAGEATAWFRRGRSNTG